VALLRLGSTPEEQIFATFAGSAGCPVAIPNSKTVATLLEAPVVRSRFRTAKPWPLLLEAL